MYDCGVPDCDAKGHYDSLPAALNAARLDFIAENGIEHPYNVVGSWSEEKQRYVYVVGCPDPCPVCDSGEPQ